MANGLDITLQVLATTRNDAASEALIAALESPHASIQEGALRALADRRSLSAQREILARWPDLPPRWRSIVMEKTGRIASAMRDAILGDDDQLCTSACDAEA